MAKILKHYIFPVVTMVGSIIGVGFLSLPYIARNVGVWPMFFYLVILGGIVLFVHLIFSEVSLHTPDHKRYPGFVGYYFGPVAKIFVLFFGIIGALTVLLSYLLVGGKFLSTMLTPVFGGPTLVYVLIYFAVASFFIYKDVKIISKFDLFAIVFLLITLLVIFISASSKIQFPQLAREHWSLGFENFLVPYGPIMFALWGIGFIPEIEEMVRGRKKTLKSIIIAAFAIIAVFYLGFTALVVGISGFQTSDSALTGLQNFLSPGIFALALSLGVVTTLIAFIAQGVLLKQVLMLDLKIKEFPAWLIVCGIPLGLYLWGFHSFIPLISFVGGFLLGIDGILIALMYLKIGGRKIIAYPLIIMFIIGAMYSLFNTPY